MLDKKLVEKLESATKNKDAAVAKLNKDIQDFYDVLNKIHMEEYEMFKYEYDNTLTEMKAGEITPPKALLNKLKKLDIKVEDGLFFKKTSKLLFWHIQQWGVTQEWKGKKAITYEPIESIIFMCKDKDGKEMTIHVKDIRHCNSILIPEATHHYQIKVKQEAAKHLNAFLEKIIKELNLEETNA